MMRIPQSICLVTLVLVGGAFSNVGNSAEKTPAIENILSELSPADWPWWRGPGRDGISVDRKAPTRWGTTTNIRWKTPIPGRGHGSAIVVGDQVVLATADHASETQLVICLDKDTGTEVWRAKVHEGNLEKGGNKKASQASGTLACDGKRFYVNFLNNKIAWTTALSRTGQILWQSQISKYKVHQGYASSPALYGDLVIVTADNKLGGAIAALNRETGKIVWKNDRPKTPNYPSPIVYTIGGRDQVLLTGCNRVSSFNPQTGSVNWEIKGSTTECVTSTVTDGVHIFTSGGYPKNHVSAVKADGSGEVVWEVKSRVYVPSMICHGGLLFGVLDAGVATCWNSSDGKQLWKGRLGGTFSSSPILVGDLLYATNEAGKTFIFRATGAKFDLLYENQLGDNVMATPTICGGRIYYRAAVQENDTRQEYLYCIGK